MPLQFQLLTLKEFCASYNKDYAESKISELEEFKEKVAQYLESLEKHKGQNEKAIVANVLAPFLQGLGFHTQAAFKQKGNSEIDLALLKDSNVEILIEAKTQKNKTEMFSAENPNCKALHECILYYLRERENNTRLKYILITDFYQFYLFRVKEFERHFYKNKKIQDAYKSLNKKDLLENQKDFYAELAKILSKEFQGNLEGDLFNTSLQGAHFDLRNDKHFKQSCAILNKEFLHDEFHRDPNALNPKFYYELLHILGLKEIETRGKILIQIDQTQKSSFAKHITDKLKNDNKPSDFETTMSHIIVWLNRILFLKLIEANLLHFNDSDKNLRFLTSAKITSFSILAHLFFEVLAKDYAERKSDKGFNFLPYLNSSLFIRDEKEICDLNALDDTLEILPFDSTQTEYKKGESVRFLAYLFDFLECFDFGKSQDSNLSDKLINSSVLGAMFEKLNGYQEGSFYTPNFITSYMCKESLQKIVLERFNIAFSWSAKDLESLRKQIDRDFGGVESQAKRLLESIRICDPSVGSGHFLVSALNEMIAIYHKLGLLGFGYKDLQIKDDEIHLTTKEGEKFAYKRLQDSNHTIQIALFMLKKSIIENNLFGVDINPNSCNIARLRLWIELLKNAYYLNFSKDKDSKIHKLQTLPNIDINIKCGNSLISHIDTNTTLENFTANLQNRLIAANKKQDLFLNQSLNSEIKDIEKKAQSKFQEMRENAESYKNEGNKQAAKVYKDTYENAYQYLCELFKRNCDEYINFHQVLKDFFHKYGYINLAQLEQETKFYIESYVVSFDFHKSVDFERKTQREIPQKELENLLSLMQIYEEFNKQEAFEWRFAFPEVLDSNGDFLGFDLIIGNPPYIRQEEIKELKPHLQKAFSIYKGTSDIYTYFYELGLKILKDNGILSFITSNKWCRAAYGEPLREFLLKNTQINTYLDLNGVKVFESATVDTSILEFHKVKADASHSLNYANPKDYNPKENKPLEESLELTQIPQDSLSIDSFIFTSPEIAALKAKIEKIGTPLKDWDINIYRGILTGCNDVKVNGKKEGVFIITSEKRAEILSICDNSKNSLKPYLAFEYNEKLAETKRDLEYKNGFLMINEKERTEQIIKPILRGQDIKRYNYAWANLWLICTRNSYIITKEEAKIFGLKIKDFKTRKRNDIDCVEIPPIDIEEYPALKAHFDEVANKGESKGKGFYNRDDKGITPYNLRNCAYLPEFAKPKIVYSEIVREPQFYLDNGEFKFGYFYAEATSFILSGNKSFKSSLEYLLGLLYSKLCTFAFKEFYAGGGLGESGYRYKKAFLENLPIPKITQSQEAEFIAIVREIIECKKSLGAKGNKNTRSLRGAEIVEKGSSSASARLELEANKRGSPLDCQKSGVFFGAKGSGEGINPFLREEKDSNNKEELQDLESRLDSLESKLDSMVFSLYGLNDEEIELISNGGGGNI